MMKRTIRVEKTLLELGSVIELPPRLGQAHGRFACVLSKISGEDSWGLVLVDVAKARWIDGSEMALSGRYLATAKLAYSSHVWAAKCAQARAEEDARQTAKQEMTHA